MTLSGPIQQELISQVIINQQGFNLGLQTCL